MESTQDKNMNKGHTCPQDGGHCCNCEGCATTCSRDGGHRGMRRYWLRHFIVLILGIIAAFCVGMKLGEIKGFMMATYGMPMRHGMKVYHGPGLQPMPPMPTDEAQPIVQ